MPDDALPRTNGGNGQIRAHYDAYVTKADNSSYRHSERKTYFDVSGATIVRALGGKWHGKSGKTYCPAHDDDNASLQVDEKDGKTLVWCGGGCSQDEVLAALIDLGLWHNGEHQEPATHHESNGGAKPSPIIPVPHGAPAMSFKHPEWGKPAAVWAYHEIDGSLVGYVARFNTRNRNGDPDKTFLPITYCDLGEGKRGWRSKGIPEPQPLYRLLKVVVRTNVPILVTEGEKAADSAQRLFDVAPEFRTGWFFSYAALAMVMSTLACAGVRYLTLEWRRCRL